jgi:hypothetical protein
MSFRPALLASLALFAFPPVARRSGDAIRYRLESKVQTTIDLSAFGQGTQDQIMGVVAWIGMTFSDSAGGRAVHVLVDSAKVDGTLPLGPESADSAKGGTISGYLDPTGHIKNLTSNPGGSLILTQIQATVASMLFPRARAGMKAGDGWMDTTETTNTANGSNLKTSTTVNYKAGGTETVSGLGATKLEADLVLSVSGTIENPMAGTMETTGSGTGHASFLVGPAGQVLGGTGASTINQNLKMAMAPAPIPVKVVQSITVTFLK